MADVADAVSRLEDDVRSLRSELKAGVSLPDASVSAHRPSSSDLGTLSSEDMAGAYRHTLHDTYPRCFRSAIEVYLTPSLIVW